MHHATNWNTLYSIKHFRENIQKFKLFKKEKKKPPNARKYIDAMKKKKGKKTFILDWFLYFKPHFNKVLLKCCLNTLNGKIEYK